MERFKSKYVLFTFFMAISVLKAGGQTTMPEELTEGNLKDQLNYLETRTRIYENYRAIREDMFQKLKTNITDTLFAAKSEIMELNVRNSTLQMNIDTLKNKLKTTELRLQDITVSKNSINFFGAEINKLTYNAILWTIISALAIILFLGFLVFKRNYFVTISTNKELKNLKEEFEAYRKTTREAREKASMDHFNEIKKLRGG
jgi:hypothetical protein